MVANIKRHIANAVLNVFFRNLEPRNHDTFSYKRQERKIQTDKRIELGGLQIVPE